jgi:hypothetical protein
VDYLAITLEVKQVDRCRESILHLASTAEPDLRTFIHLLVFAIPRVHTNQQLHGAEEGP